MRLIKCHLKNNWMVPESLEKGDPYPKVTSPSLKVVFQLICTRWHWPQIDLFAVRFNNKLLQFVSPVPDPLAWAVNALSLPWEDLDSYAFSLVAILSRVVEKCQDWPNMLSFQNLVIMSCLIPLCLPKLLSQPFSGIHRRNLQNLNLHAWLFVPRVSSSNVFLRQ